MAKLTKRQKAIAEKVQAGKQYGFEEAAQLLADLSTIKFKESVDIAINLGVDPRKSDQVVRGATVLPNGTGKSVRVAVFTQGPAAEAALAAGADKVGMMNCCRNESRRPELRRCYRLPGCDARGRSTGSGAGSAWSDAEPESRHRYPGRGHCRGRTPRLVRCVSVPTRTASFTPPLARSISSRSS